MIKYLIALAIFIHGLIHIMGFAKSFNYGNISQFTKEISKPVGLVWLLTALLFTAVTSLLLIKKDAWYILAFVAILISQILIFSVWKDAKWGTIANLIILITAIVEMQNHLIIKT